MDITFNDHQLSNVFGVKPKLTGRLEDESSSVPTIFDKRNLDLDKLHHASLPQYLQIDPKQFEQILDTKVVDLAMIKRLANHLKDNAKRLRVFNNEAIEGKFSLSTENSFAFNNNEKLNVKFDTEKLELALSATNFKNPADTDIPYIFGNRFECEFTKNSQHEERVLTKITCHPCPGEAGFRLVYENNSGKETLTFYRKSYREIEEIDPEKPNERTFDLSA